MTEPRIDIVAATRADLPEVQRLAGVIWRRHYPGIITPEQIDYMLERGYAMDALARFVSGPGAGLLGAVSGGRMVGFAAWYVTDDAHEAKLDKLYVLQDWQRHGLGARLIARVAAAARAEGARTLILNVNKQNTQAIRAYEKHGFATRSAVVVDIGNGYAMDDYVMARPL